MDLLVTCACGHRMTVSEFAAGMTAPCPACGTAVTVGPDNSKPIENKAVVTPASPSAWSNEPEIVYAPLQTASLKSNCARCGRPFRGDWDRQQSSIGLICNICSNLVANERQATGVTGYVPPVDSLKLDPKIDPSPYEPVEVEAVTPSWKEKYWPDQEMIRRIAIGTAIAFMLYTVYVIIRGAWVVGPAPGETARPGSVVADAEAIPTLPTWAAVVMRVMTLASGFLSSLCGLYVFLTMSKRLPNDTFVGNVVEILPTAALLTALAFAASMLPMAGIFMIVLVPGVIFVRHGFEAQDIIHLPLGMFLGGVLQAMFYYLIYWGLSAVAL